MSKQIEIQETIVKLWGIPFTRMNLKETLKYLQEKLESKQKTFVATPNPEMLLEAEKNLLFQKILQSTDLNIADGIAILWATHFLHKTSSSSSKVFIVWEFFFSLCSILWHSPQIKKLLPERVSGTDLMKAMCLSAKKNDRFFLLGAAPGIAEKAKEKLQKLNPNLEIVGTFAGSPTDPKNLEMINHSKANILFVAFGAPKQELWIHKNLSELPHITLTIGVGGAFDFLSGNVRRAPIWMQKIGLEWLFRLILQPKRIKRIFNATVKFPLHILKKRLQDRE